ncbi:MAG: 6-phosphofructokinase, partial [Dehalococcoidia bacterium]|nr:6-phosphofructokinase [Dehalococcoidia bacterium]
MTNQNGRIGILVGGGPAPGINSVISAAVIEAVNSGYQAVGIMNGYEYLVKGDASRTVELGIEDVTTIHTQGGSILHTSRTNPTRRTQDLETCVATLDHRLDLGRDRLGLGEARLVDCVERHPLGRLERRHCWPCILPPRI